ncbi:Protein kinase domain-containing protein [Mycena kentingensis (nom. inval.)]|nr:Protein kinase domain-containing protein [Mycena kentingensis (nom. inval.)]
MAEPIDIKLVSAGQVFLGEEPDEEDDDAPMPFWDMLFQKDGEYYSYRHEDITYDSSPQGLKDLFSRATIVPHKYYCAAIPPDATIAPNDAQNDPGVYLKLNLPICFDPWWSEESRSSYAHLQRQELEICEVLRRHPHPNICAYLGYRPHTDGLRIACLCFERCEATLVDAVNKGTPDTPRILDGIRDAITHLHSLGYAHNDINPRNIMLAQDGRPVLIDFDSAMKLGEPLGIKGATFGWEYEGDVSKAENDLWGLKEVEKYLAGERPAGSH